MFFIDWEQSKVQPSENFYEPAKSSPVSVWRSIFMSNEWAAMQTYRNCNVYFTLLGVVILLEGASWKNLGTAKPSMQDLTDGVLNPILLFATDSICWLLLILGQKLFRFLLYDRFYRNKFNQFVDILSISNISLIVLDESRHGYYIHGRSVHATSDTTLEELNNCLQREANDMVPRRGLLDTNQQTFEIFVTHEFRILFDKIYRPSEGVCVN